MEDPVQDGVAAAAPGTGKSKLETLPKEDLIKFAKKQMMMLQKAKSRCTELDKEIEELKSKPADGGTDDIIKLLLQVLSCSYPLRKPGHAPAFNDLQIDLHHWT